MNSQSVVHWFNNHSPWSWSDKCWPHVWYYKTFALSIL